MSLHLNTDSANGLNPFTQLVVSARDPLDEQLALEAQKVSEPVLEATDYWEDGFERLEEATERLRAQLAQMEDENAALNQDQNRKLQRLENEFQTDAATLASEQTKVQELSVLCDVFKGALSRIKDNCDRVRSYATHFAFSCNCATFNFDSGHANQFLVKHFEGGIWKTSSDDGTHLHGLISSQVPFNASVIEIENIKTQYPGVFP